MSSSDFAAPVPPARRTLVLAGGLLVLFTLAAYSNSLTGPFVGDDLIAIPNNPTIRHLWPLPGALAPPADGSPVTGRPLLNLSFALNHAIGGDGVRGYHALNLLIHILAGLVLFGLVRRTLLLPALRPRFGAASLPLGLLVASLWTLHPLQTESVTYISQRAESLMGLCYLLTFYCFVRGAGPGGRSRPWLAGSVAACLLGMTAKEVMVGAPLLVLLYDRTFLAGSFREAWRLRSRCHLALAGTWIVLAGLAIPVGDRGGTIGLRSGITPWAYALCQSRGIFHYLRLCLWPAPLVFDYGSDFVSFRQALPWAVALLLILAGSAFLLARRPVPGFPAAWFFIILAPTSSFVGGTRQMLAEHRMYLPLAAVAAAVAIGAWGRWGRPALFAGFAAAAALGAATFLRNADYRDPVALWSDTVARRPGNAGAHNNLAIFLAGEPGRRPEAIAQYEAALRLNPDYAEAHNNLGFLLTGIPGRLPDALAQYGAALRLRPDYAEAHYNLANLLAGMGRQAEALAHYEAAIGRKPDFAEAHNNLADLLAGMGRRAEAVAQYEAALRLRPDYAEAHNSLGLELAGIPGRLPDAFAHCETALRLRPDYAEAHYNLGNLLAGAGRPAEAAAQYEAALRLEPGLAEAHNNLAILLSRQPGRQSEAVAHYEAALRLKPASIAAHCNLGSLLAGIGRPAEAVGQYREALRLKPDSAEIHASLGMALGLAGRMEEAVRELEEALRIKPGLADARYNLGLALRAVGRIPEANEQFEAAGRLRAASAGTAR